VILDHLGQAEQRHRLEHLVHGAPGGLAAASHVGGQRLLRLGREERRVRLVGRGHADQTAAEHVGLAARHLGEGERIARPGSAAVAIRGAAGDQAGCDQHAGERRPHHCWAAMRSAASLAAMISSSPPSIRK
jgi:hypothetical protein